MGALEERWGQCVAGKPAGNLMSEKQGPQSLSIVGVLTTLERKSLWLCGTCEGKN